MARRISSPELIGRKRECAALDAVLTRAEGGDPAIVLIAGEAGVGKTRLIRALEQRVRGRAVVMRGECLELEGGELPYAPLAAAFADLAAGPYAAAVNALPADARAELARVFPELGPQPDAPAAPEDDGRSAQARLYQRLLSLLRQLAEHQTTLLIVEDAHWADRSTRDFLAYAARNLRTERLAVLITYRTDELHSEHPLRRLLGELIRMDPVERLVIGRLPREAHDLQLAGILGHAPEPQVAEAIFSRSEGNPFYAEELLAARGHAGELPSDLRDALLLRVDSLSTGARRIAQTVAAVGRPVEHRLLRAVVALPDAELASAAREAVDRHVLVHDRRAGAYEHRHALIREEVHKDLLPGERMALHAAIAGAIVEEGGSSPAELAHHWHAAGEAAAALPASIEAGLAAQAVYAHAEALGHFRRALELWEVVGPAVDDVPVDHLDLMACAAEAATLTGDHEGGVALCERALGALDAAADPVRAAWFHERLGRCQPWNVERSLSAFREALHLLPNDSTAQRARLLGDEAFTLTFATDWEEARAGARAALAMAQEVGAVAEEGYARATLGVALSFLGDPQSGEEELRQASAIARRRGSAEDIARVHLDLAEVLRLRGKVEDALRVTLEGEQAAERLGVEGSFGRFLSVNAGEDLFRLGRWDEAERRLGRLCRLDLAPTGELLCMTVQGRLAAARGDFEAASAALERAVRLRERATPAEFVPNLYGGVAEIALWRGRYAEARDAIRRGFEALADQGDALNAPLLHELGVRIEADAAQHRPGSLDGSRAAAEALIGGLDVLLAQHPEPLRPPEAMARRAGCEAELARLLGEPAHALWDGVATGWEQLARPYAVAYCRWRQAEALLLAGKDRTGAAAALRAAFEAASALGARPLLGEIDALARRARLDVAPAAESPAAAMPDGAGSVAVDLGLTKREVDVLALIAEGLTDGQIAERLFLSKKTVGHHVSHILAKLNATNRLTAATVAHRHGLV